MLTLNGHNIFQYVITVDTNAGKITDDRKACVCYKAADAGELLLHTTDAGCWRQGVKRCALKML